MAAHLTWAALVALPAFPDSWAVHEDQYAKVAGSIVNWHGARPRSAAVGAARDIDG